MVGFTASIAVGWAAGNSAPTTILRALAAFVVCLLVGKMVGHVAQRTIEEDIAAYKRDHPIPVDPLKAGLLDENGSNVDIIEEGETVSETSAGKEPVTSRSAA